MKEQEDAQLACTQLQGELAVCQAEHASQIHAIRLEAETPLRTFEVEAERRHELALADRLKKAEATFDAETDCRHEMAVADRLKNADSIHTQVVNTLQDTIAKHEVAHIEIVAKADDSEPRRKARAKKMLELTNAE